MLAEALALLWFAWTRFDLAGHDEALYTFSFLLLLYMAAFSIVSARERRWFWTTMPSATLIAALAADVLLGTAVTYAGLPGLMPLPWWQTSTLFGFAMVACLVVNDTREGRADPALGPRRRRRCALAARPATLVIATDEEQVIADEALAVIGPALR